MIHTAIIDDGVNEDRFNLGPLNHNIEITPELAIHQRVDYDTLSPSHGTTCSAVIKKYAPSAVLSSIKILNERDKGMQEQVLHALRWCFDKHTQLINLSLGSIHFKDFSELKRIVHEAYRLGVIIVAACNNQDIYTCPASFSQVIGVKCSKVSFTKGDFNGELQERQYIFNPYPIDGIDITACAKHLLYLDTGEVKVTPPSNSLAAPFITALVYNIMETSPGITLEEIKNKLKEKAINANAIINHTHPYSYDIDWVDNAVIFNMKNDKINFFYYPRHISETDNIIPIQCKTLKEGLDKIKVWLSKNNNSISNYDTIIFVKDPGIKDYGYDRQMINYDIFQCNKNIVWIDDDMKDSPNIFSSETGVKVWYPGVYRYYKMNNIPNKEITVPIVTVYDMTKSRRYIHFLIHLVNAFRQNGYFAVASVDTSMGILEELEYAYLPVISDQKHAINIDRLYTIEKRYHPDIILAGISGENKAHDYFSLLENTLEIDIKIILCDKNNIQHLIQDNSCSQIIVISTNKEIDREIYREIPIFPYPEDQDFSEIYGYIIDLYNNDRIHSKVMPSVNK